MPFSSGVFSLVAGNPVTTGTTISSTWANDTLDDIADNGLSLCVLKDGSQGITANLPLGGFKLTGLGNGSAVADSSRVSQVQNGSFNILTSVAGTNTITASVTPTPAAYAEGQVFTGILVNTITGQATLNVSSLGAQPIFLAGATATASSLRSRIPISFAYVSTTSSTGFHVLGYSGFTPYDPGTLASTFTFDGSGGTTGSVTMRWQKSGDFIFLTVPGVTGTSGTSSTLLASNTALPAAIRPATNQYLAVMQITNNGSAVTPAGMLILGSNGVVTIYRDGANTAFTNTSTCGLSGEVTIVYQLV